MENFHSSKRKLAVNGQDDASPSTSSAKKLKWDERSLSKVMIALEQQKQQGLLHPTLYEWVTSEKTQPIRICSAKQNYSGKNVIRRVQLALNRTAINFTDYHHKEAFLHDFVDMDCVNMLRGECKIIFALHWIEYDKIHIRGQLFKKQAMEVAYRILWLSAIPDDLATEVEPFKTAGWMLMDHLFNPIKDLQPDDFRAAMVILKLYFPDEHSVIKCASQWRDDCSPLANPHQKMIPFINDLISSVPQLTCNLSV